MVNSFAIKSLIGKQIERKHAKPNYLNNMTVPADDLAPLGTIRC